MIMMILFRCKRWLINCRRKDLDIFLKRDPAYLNRNCRLCSDHFENSEFVNASSRDKLKRTAVPTVFNVPNPPKRLSSARPLRGIIQLLEFFE